MAEGETPAVAQPPTHRPQTTGGRVWRQLPAVAGVGNTAAGRGGRASGRAGHTASSGCKKKKKSGLGRLSGRGQRRQCRGGRRRRRHRGRRPEEGVPAAEGRAWHGAGRGAYARRALPPPAQRPPPNAGHDPKPPPASEMAEWRSNVASGQPHGGPRRKTESVGTRAQGGQRERPY